MPAVSVIIPCFNSAPYLDYTLAAFLLQTFKDFELIVIDDGSTDTVDFVVEKYSDQLNINYIKQKHCGLSSARNKGLDAAQGNYIINIDGDRFPSPRFIEEHLSVINKQPKTVSIGLKKFVFTYFNHNLNISYSNLLKYLRRNINKANLFIYSDDFQLFTPNELVMDFNNIINSCFISEPRDNYHYVVDTFSDELSTFQFGWCLATGGNIAFDRASALNIRFDTNYKGWGLEDTDFAYQLFLQGYNFSFNKKAINYHQAHPRGKNESKELNNNFKYFCNKYNSPEVHLFSRVFKGQFDLLKANRLLNSIVTEQNNLLIEDYLTLLKADTN